jgi:hypothetical protein
VVTANGGFDQFDTFRGYLNRLRPHRIAIQTGVDAHAVTLIGQAYRNGELCLFGPDSYGKSTTAYRIGQSVDGLRYFNRWEVSQLYEGYIAIDMPRATAELLNRYDGKAIKVNEKMTASL